MREAYGSPEFWRDYRLAVEGRPLAPAAGPKPGTLSWLIAKYVASAEWSELKPATRKQRHGFYRAMEKTAGDEPLALINRRAILAGRDRRRDTPYAANNFLKSLRGLFRWALDADHVKVDPTTGIKLLAGNNDDGFHAWTEDELERFEAKWAVGTRQWLAFDLLLFTGLCRGDVVRLGRPHVCNGEFTIRTEKTGTVVIAPILPPLTASIAAAATGELTFLATERGLPFGKESSATGSGRLAAKRSAPGPRTGSGRPARRNHSSTRCSAGRTGAGKARPTPAPQTEPNWLGKRGRLPHLRSRCGIENEKSF